MDAATINQRIYKGRGKAALRIGLLCNVCRPSGAQPLSNIVTTLNAAFNAKNPNYTKPNLYNDPVWFADLDGTRTLPGDYLVRQSDGQIWFIAAQEQLLPIVMVSCNRSVTLMRQPASSAVGVVPYGGLTDLVSPLSWTADTSQVTADSMMATADGSYPGIPWPASILIGGRALSGDGLPTDVKQGAWKILLPPSFPLTISAGDILIDDLARRYAVEAAEQSELGWRLVTNEEHV